MQTVDVFKQEGSKKMYYEHDARSGAGALFVPAGILLGLGVGFLVHNIPAGLFSGMGLGFVFFALASLFRK